jgi:hypothetical protein
MLNIFKEMRDSGMSIKDIIIEVVGGTLMVIAIVMMPAFLFFLSDI